MPSEQLLRPHESVTAQVVLRNTAGRSIFDSGGAITSANVASFAVEAERVSRAVAALRALGFEVLPGAPTVSITGAPGLFERVFKTRLSRRTSGFASSFVADGPIIVPPELEELVAGVLLPEAPELFQ
jgi:hypothetical protein